MRQHAIEADLVVGQEVVRTPHGIYRLERQIYEQGRYAVTYNETDQFAEAELRATTLQMLLHAANEKLASGDVQAGAACLYEAEVLACRQGHDDVAMRLRQTLSRLGRSIS